MTAQTPHLVDVWRGDFLESQHRGHWAVVTAAGEVLEGGGDPAKIILPRSSLKPIQALPLVESGAAAAFNMSVEELALACASHQGAPIHTTRVGAWLARIEQDESDLRCGMQPPATADDRQSLRDANWGADQIHNNCSGKHSGFLTLSRHFGAGPDYIDPDHPVQRAVREAVEDMTGAESPGYAIDGCSAPNFATSLSGLARAIARIATAREGACHARERAAFSIRTAMSAHPNLVAGEGRACTRLMRIMGPEGIVKTGAEGVFVAALPRLGVGVALKIEDGAGRAAEVAITVILVRLGVLDPNDPAVAELLTPPIKNRREVTTGRLAPSSGFARR